MTIKRHHGDLLSACKAIEDVRGGIVYRQGWVSSDHQSEIAKWDIRENRVLPGDGANNAERAVIALFFPSTYPME